MSKKRILSIALTLALIFTMLPFNAFAVGTESVEAPMDAVKQEKKGTDFLTVQFQEVKEEPTTFMGALAVAAAALNPFNWFGDNGTAAGLTVEILRQVSGEWVSFDDPVTGVTDASGKVVIDITALNGKSGPFRIYVSGFKSNVAVTSAGWTRFGASFYQEFADYAALTGAGELVVNVATLQASDVFYIAPNFRLGPEGNNVPITGVEVTLTPLAADGTPIYASAKTLTTVNGVVSWQDLPKDIKYHLTFSSPVKGAYLIAADKERDAIVYQGSLSKSEQEGYFTYVFLIDPKSNHNKDALGCTDLFTFLVGLVDLTVQKTFDSSVTDKNADIWFGIRPFSGATITWVQLGANGKAEFGLIEKYQSENLDTGFIDKSMGGQSYYLFEYAPASMQPTGGWTIASPGINNLPGAALSGYVLWQKSTTLSFDENDASRTEPVANKEAEWEFGVGGVSLESTFNGTAYIGYRYEWDAEKNVSFDGVSGTDMTLTEKGLDYTAHYQVDFTRGADPREESTGAYTLYFNATVARFLYDQRAAVGDNKIEGTFTLYKEGVPVDSCSVTRLLRNHDGAYNASLYRMNLTAPRALKDDQYQLGDVVTYTIEFEGTIYYTLNGVLVGQTVQEIPVSGSLKTPFTSIINLVSTGNKADALDQNLKDFSDTITVPDPMVTIKNINNVKVNGTSVAFNFVDGNKLAIAGDLIPVSRTVTVAYDVHFTDTSYLAPGGGYEVEYYTVGNAAQALTKDTEIPVDDDEEFDVETPGFVYFKIGKYLDFLGSLEREAGVRVELWANGTTLVAAGTTIAGSEDIILTLPGTAGPSPTAITKANFAQIFKVWDNETAKFFQLRIAVADLEYPPHTKKADSTLESWAVVGSYYVTDIGSYPRTSGGSKVSGPQTIEIHDIPKTRIEVEKNGLGISEATFHLYQVDNSGKHTFITSKPASQGLDVSGLPYGRYRIYEVTSSGYRPFTSNVEWVAADSSHTWITVLAGSAAYYYWVELKEDAKEIKVTATNKANQDLEIIKSAPDSVHPESSVFKFEVYLVGDSSMPLSFTAVPGKSNEYNYNPDGIPTVLYLTLAPPSTEGRILMHGLPIGEKYTVKELKPDAVGGLDIYDWTADTHQGTSGTLSWMDSLGGAEQITITNKFNLSLKIEYYKDDMNPAGYMAGKDEFVTGLSYNQLYTITNALRDKNLPDGYKFERTDPASGGITVQLNGNLIKVLYTPRDDLSYIVEYYKDDLTPANKLGQTTDISVSYLDQITIAAGTAEGQLDWMWLPGYNSGVQQDPVPYIIQASGNVIKVLYLKNENLKKTLSYTVEYYKDNILFETQPPFTENVWVGAPDILTVLPVDTSNDRYTGYKFHHVNPDPIPGTIADNGVIRVYYVTDDDRTKELSYTVEYYKDGVWFETLPPIMEDVWINAADILIVQPVDTSDNRYGDDYKFDRTDPGTIPGTIADGGVIKVYYVSKDKQYKTLSYTVEYYKDNTLFETLPPVTQTVLITEPDTLTVQPVDTSDNRYGDDYKFDRTNPGTIPGTIADGGVIKVYYVREKYEYKVRYYKDTLEEVNYIDHVLGTGDYGAAIPADLYWKAPAGYTVPGTRSGATTITANKDNNIAYVLYVKKPTSSYTVEHYYEGDDDPFDTVVVPGVTPGTVVNSVDDSSKKDPDYYRSRVEGLPAVVEDDGTVIKVYYRRAEFTIKVTHVYHVDNTEVHRQDETVGVSLGAPGRYVSSFATYYGRPGDGRNYRMGYPILFKEESLIPASTDRFAAGLFTPVLPTLPVLPELDLEEETEIETPALEDPNMDDEPGEEEESEASEDTEEPENTEESGEPEESEEAEETEDPEELEDPENSEAAEDPENSENPEESEGAEETEDPESIEEPEDTAESEEDGESETSEESGESTDPDVEFISTMPLSLGELLVFVAEGDGVVEFERLYSDVVKIFNQGNSYEIVINYFATSSSRRDDDDGGDGEPGIYIPDRDIPRAKNPDNVVILDPEVPLTNLPKTGGARKKITLGELWAKLGGAVKSIFKRPESGEL